MPRPRKGEPFPDFELGNFSTRRARSEGPLLLVVWKTECSTSRLTVPYLERMHKAYPGARCVGIMQNQPNEVAQYCQANGIAMPTFADDHLRITRYLEVATVPDYWLIAKGGEVLMAGIGWDRALTEEIAKKVASLTGAFYSPVVQDSDGVPAFKAG